MKSKELTPAEAFPPNEYILDELAAKNWNVNDFAIAANVDILIAAEIVSGKMRITEKKAEIISKAFGASASVWLNLQKNYDDYLERKPSLIPEKPENVTWGDFMKFMVKKYCEQTRRKGRDLHLRKLLQRIYSPPRLTTPAPFLFLKARGATFGNATRNSFRARRVSKIVVSLCRRNNQSLDKFHADRLRTHEGEGTNCPRPFK